jgi:colicin import membrane protein
MGGAVRRAITMDSKSRWSSKPLCVHRGRAAHEVALLRIDNEVQNPAEGESLSPDFTRPAQPPRERGTWYALVLAVAFHALLAAVLIPSLHRPSLVRMNGQQLSAATHWTAPQGSRTATPRVVTQLVISSAATTHASRLAAGLRQPSQLPRQTKHATPHLQRELRFASRASSLVHQAAFASQAGASEGLARAWTTDREHEAHVAALQATAGPLNMGPAQLEGARDTTISPGYADKLVRRLRANLVAPFAIQGNPSAVIEVKCAPTGALLGARIRRSSGNPHWDRAVLSAVEKSDPLPVDANGAAPSSLTITFQAKG